MKSRHALFALAAAALLSACTSPGSYYQPLIPLADVGSPGGDWRPYVPPEPARPEDREWRPSNPDWGRERAEPSVRSEALSAPRNETDISQAEPRQAPTAPVVKGTFPRAEPRDPPSDLSTRRTYSSRPDRNPKPSADDSAFGKPSSGASGQSAAPRGVRSEWADKAVRTDNRPAFDRMVRESTSRGQGSFEDEAGRIYYGEAVGREGGCSVVEVTVTTSGGLPVVARGTAYDCR